MIDTEEKKEKAILAGVHTGCIDILKDTTQETLDELEELAKTAGVTVVGCILQNREAPDSATYLGEGKLDELRQAVQALEADVVIFDDELSPIQIRNISDAVDRKVIDRTALILDIFASRAQTKEGKLQVELAQLRYMLPRLAGMGSSMSRLGGGIGTRGPGESKLESDRRHIRRRITALSAELAEVQRHRDLLRERRAKNGQTVVALVGYTNAGKSTMLNRLTDARVLAEDKLFATLDPVQRRYVLSDNREILLVDTVGFIRKLPHHLVQAFKSTLEEAVLADVLIHIIDASNPEAQHQIAVVNQILSDLGAQGKPVLAVWNKIDLVTERSSLLQSVDSASSTVAVSAQTGEGMEALLQKLEEIVPGAKRRVRLLLPFSEGGLISELHQQQVVLEQAYTADGVVIDALIDAGCYAQCRNYITDRQG